MKLHQLRPAKGATQREKDLVAARLQATVAHPQRVIKVIKAVVVLKIKLAHEGGQMPIQRRIPKRGFNNIHRVEYKVFNLGQIDQLAEKYGITEFTLPNLYGNKLISQNDKVKILGNGEIKSKLTFKVNAVSEKAKAAIEAAGGSVEILA